jgi:signal transduction histidine kinase
MTQETIIQNAAEYISRTAKGFVHHTSLPSIYRLIAESIKALTGSAEVVLLRKNVKHDPELYNPIISTSENSLLTKVAAALGGIRLQPGSTDARLQKEYSSFSVQGITPTSFLRADRSSSSLAALLFGERDRRESDLPTSQDASYSAAMIYMAIVEELFTQQLGNIVGRLTDQLAVSMESGATSLRHLLVNIGTVLHENLGSSGTVIFERSSRDQFMVAEAIPRSPKFSNIKAHPIQMPQDLILQKRTYRKAGSADKTAESSHALEPEDALRIQDYFGWNAANSYLSQFIMYERQCVGLVHVYDSPEGLPLGPDHETIIRGIAERLSAVLRTVYRRQRLGDLHIIVNELASFQGQELWDKLLEETRKWVEKYIKPGCTLAIVGKANLDKMLIAESSPRLVPKAMDLLCETSAKLQGGFTSWPREGRKAYLSHRNLRRPGLGAPVYLPGSNEIAGHLFLFHRYRFSSEQTLAAREIARDLAVILNAERIRQDWINHIGLFGHSLLGPVQGLVSNARAITRLARRAGVNKSELAKLESRIMDEAQTVRLWRENQRVYQPDIIEIVPTYQPLKPVVERCFERFREPIRSRDIPYRLQWKERGELWITFDSKAVDIALSNIIDNAKKYAFHKGYIDVRVESEGSQIRIEVEDFGHEIAEEHKEAIYRPGLRFIKDPVRNIEGQGLGLAMAKATIEAHDGSLSHTCRRSNRELRGRSGVPAAHVCFTVVLPTHWSRAYRAKQRRRMKRRSY